MPRRPPRCRPRTRCCARSRLSPTADRRRHRTRHGRSCNASRPETTERFSVAREVRGGVTTFMAMAYILLLNPL
ncbi:hypothetical protein ACWCRF_34410, partial [Streptomyces sp. NPDC002405]